MKFNAIIRDPFFYFANFPGSTALDSGSRLRLVRNDDRFSHDTAVSILEFGKRTYVEG